MQYCAPIAAPPLCKGDRYTRQNDLGERKKGSGLDVEGKEERRTFFVILCVLVLTSSFLSLLSFSSHLPTFIFFRCQHPPLTFSTSPQKNFYTFGRRSSPRLNLLPNHTETRNTKWTHPRNQSRRSGSRPSTVNSNSTLTTASMPVSLPGCLCARYSLWWDALAC